MFLEVPRVDLLHHHHQPHYIFPLPPPFLLPAPPVLVQLPLVVLRPSSFRGRFASHADVGRGGHGRGRREGASDPPSDAEGAVPAPSGHSCRRSSTPPVYPHAEAQQAGSSGCRRRRCWRGCSAAAAGGVARGGRAAAAAAGGVAQRQCFRAILAAAAAAAAAAAGRRVSTAAASASASVSTAAASASSNGVGGPTFYAAIACAQPRLQTQSSQ